LTLGEDAACLNIAKRRESSANACTLPAVKVRIKLKGLPAAIAFALAAAILAWPLHWLLTCVGSSGELAFREKRTFLGFGYTLGHTSALMWVNEGETIHVRYRVRMSEDARVSFRIRKLRPPWKLLQTRAVETVYVRSSEDGTFSLTATETGLHKLDRSESSVWEGSATLAWDVR
jgi:hypothetical protein